MIKPLRNIDLYTLLKLKPYVPMWLEKNLTK